MDRNTASPKFTELIATAPAWDAEFTELDSVPLDRLELTEDALILDKNSIPLTPDGRNRLLGKAGAPLTYLTERGIDVQIVALRDHLRQGDFGPVPRAVLRDGELFTLLCDSLVELSHYDVLSAVAESLGKDIHTLNSSRIDYAAGRLELDLVSPGRYRATDLKINSQK
jgi:hypothetical protein